MSVWDELPGQEHAVAQLSRAVEGGNPTHAWLFTGPPGSGRSNAARAFAAALQCDAGTGCGTCKNCRLVAASSHPDVAMVTTENVTYAIADVRELIAKAQARPSGGRWRIIIMEDADRMAERTTNVLLKAIEEPPPHTIWILCAPSPADVLVTIRSRCRPVSLRVPSREAVADLLVRRDHLTAEQAEFAARISQSHIGVARRLARSEEARLRRDTTVKLPLRLRSVSDAVRAAGEIVEISTTEASSSAQERADAETAALRETLGLEPDAVVPPQLRSQFKQVEESAKRRARRGISDSLDRSLIDLTTVYRDVLVIQLGAETELVNDYLGEPLRAYAARGTPTDTLGRIDLISRARQRIAANVTPLIAMEALMAGLIPRRS
ncbi:DNA polymerase III subunit delta' [Zhihengliuella halotolerans]|uniref:DNA polymerase-3 subunit delta n=1 Tax=Zhihengliuella halotolerans TaxID=370736 RepID=A0A4Q8A910_9MICC|nr:DNA polymerase III subunit delta' [Zhihengliuella halotolerans]RZU60550.1 DNA polymerase-3 subunit delta' [Zhihengliuella halotolerans]